MPLWLTYILIALSVHRLTRLVTRDKFPGVAVPRYYVTNWFDPSDEYKREQLVKHPDRPAPERRWGWFGSSVAYLVECDWCVSVWVSAAVVTGATHFTNVPLPFFTWLAASTVTGLIATHEPD